MEKKIKTTIFICNCVRCGRQWASRKTQPMRCPGCGVNYWWRKARKYRKKGDV